MKINYIGFHQDRFNWSIEIGNEIFEYFTGLGHCPHSRIKTVHDLDMFKYRNSSKKYIIKDGYAYLIDRPNQPDVNDILECLFSDKEAGEMSFNDFCDSFGYSNDSISAFNIYQRCMKNAQKVRKLEMLGLISRPIEVA